MTPASGRVRQEDPEFKTSLGCLKTLSQNKIKQNKAKQ
jgi:hypothetical protein